VASNTYDINSLIEALVSAERHCSSAPELRDLHQARAVALSHALGASEVHAAARRAGGDFMLTHAIASAALCKRHPFEGFLECPKEVYELVQLHAADISHLSHELYKAWLALARTLLIRSHPHLANATATSDALRSLGFDDESEPDELDFF
jgi:hypothetical protein